MALPLTNQWLCEHVRVSFIGAPETFEYRAGIWKALRGEEPETRTEKPLEASVTEEGGYGAARLIATSFPGRIDIALGVGMPAAAVWPSIGELQEAVDSLRELIFPLSERFTFASRLAVGAVSTFRTLNREQGYKHLAALLPEVRFGENMRDFHLQVNYPQESRVLPGVSVNRLSRWMAGEMFIAQNSVPPSNIPPTSLGSMVRSEVDINTAESCRLSLGADACRDLLSELFEHALVTTREGTRS